MQRELRLELRDLGNPKMILSLARGFPLLGFQRQLGSKALLHQDVTPAFLDATLPLQPVKSRAQPLDSELVWGVRVCTVAVG